jgi:hypothetical protein
MYTMSRVFIFFCRGVGGCMKLEFHLNKDTCESINFRVGKNPASLRRQMLLDTINYFKIKYPKYSSLTSGELVAYLGSLNIDRTKAMGLSETEFNDLFHLTQASDIYETFNGAQEFVLGDNFNKQISDKMATLDNYRGVDFSDMKIPFENNIITIESDDGFSPFNLQVYLLDGALYKDTELVYTLKVFMGTTWILDAHFVISKLPRVWISCDVESCTYRTSSEIFSNSPNKLPYCLKSLNSCQSCPFPTKPDLKFSRAVLAVKSMIFFYEVMRRFYKNPNFVYRTSKRLVGNHSKDSLKRNTPKEVKNTIDSGYIKLTDTRYVYVNKEPSTPRNNPSNRTSPCEHLRKSHFRRLKNGKIIKVESSIVNSGKPKKKIKIDS